MRIKNHNLFISFALSLALKTEASGGSEWPINQFTIKITNKVALFVITFCLFPLLTIKIIKGNIDKSLPANESVDQLETYFRRSLHLVIV